MRARLSWVQAGPADGAGSYARRAKAAGAASAKNVGVVQCQPALGVRVRRPHFGVRAAIAKVAAVTHGAGWCWLQSPVVYEQQQRSEQSELLTQHMSKAWQ